jgi:uncharacterized membrane protein YgcG
MSTSVSIVRSSERRTWRVAGLALGAALLMGASARADGDFENAFEASLGHFLAFEVVQAAKSVLFYGAPVAVPVPYVAPSYYPAVVGYPAPAVVVGYAGYSRPRAHYHEQRHHYKPPKHHRHDRHYGHGGGHGGWDRGRGHGYRDDHRGKGHGYRDRDDDDRGRGHGRGHGGGRPGRGQGRDGGRSDGGRYAHR